MVGVNSPGRLLYGSSYRRCLLGVARTPGGIELGCAGGNAACGTGQTVQASPQPCGCFGGKAFNSGEHVEAWRGPYIYLSEVVSGNVAMTPLQAYLYRGISSRPVEDRGMGRWHGPFARKTADMKLSRDRSSPMNPGFEACHLRKALDHRTPDYFNQPDFLSKLLSGCRDN
jgi:hypothetical protein